VPVPTRVPPAVHLGTRESAGVSSSPVRSAGSGGIPAAGHIRVKRTRKFPAWAPAPRRPEIPGRPGPNFITAQNHRRSTFSRHPHVRGRAGTVRCPPHGTAVAIPANPMNGGVVFVGGMVPLSQF
jgi:hypothetical protein